MISLDRINVVIMMDCLNFYFICLKLAKNDGRWSFVIMSGEGPRLGGVPDVA